MDGRPARIDPVFIWQTEPTWFSPSAQHDRMTLISSTCCAILGYQSDTQIPLWPYCLKVRLVPISELLPVPIAVMGLPNEAGIGCPFNSFSLGLGSKSIDMAGAAFHEEPDNRLGFGRVVRGLGREGIDGRVRL